MRLLRLGMGVVLMFSVCACMAQSTTAPATTTPTTQPDLSHLPADVRELVQAWAEVKPIYERGTPPTIKEYPLLEKFDAKYKPLGYKYDRADFIITGKVVDEDDKPVDNVRISVEAVVQSVPNLLTGGMEGGSRDEVSINVDKEFNLSYKNKSSLRLKFVKDGYLYEELPLVNAASGLDQKELNRLLAGGAYEPGLVRKDVKVVLCKSIIPSPTVTEGVCEIELTPEKPVGYVVMGAPNKEKRGNSLDCGTRVLDDKTPLPANAIVFRIPLTGDHKAVQISPLCGPKTWSEGFSSFPSWMEMEMVGEKAGLVRFRPYKRQIRNVPENGYEQVVRLTDQQILAEKMSIVEYAQCPLFAFRRADGKFGWYQIRIASDTGSVVVYIRLYFQKDGTRYVPRPK